MLEYVTEVDFKPAATLMPHHINMTSNLSQNEVNSEQELERHTL